MALNHRLVLEAPQDVPDGAGGHTRTWAALGTLWGRVDPRSGRLGPGDVGAISVSGFTVWVRGAPVGHSNRPSAGQRFVMQGRVLSIEAVTEEEPSALYLRCICTEEVSP
nr:head-tail adaptor protein [Sagittula salina]